MRFLITFVFSLMLSNSALASYSSQQVCYSDLNKCFIVMYETETLITYRILYPEGQQVDTTKIRQLNDSGIEVFALRAPQYQQLASTAVLVNTTFTQQMQNVASTPDDSFNEWKSVGKCGLGTFICAGTTYQTIVTGGLTFWLAEASCAVTLIECYEMIEKINAWQTAQKEKADAKRLAAQIAADSARSPSNDPTGRTESPSQGNPGPSSLDAVANPAGGGSVPCPKCTIKGSGGTPKPKHET